MFSHKILLLNPFKIQKRVEFIITDGDTQQCNKILRALKGLLPNTIEGGYGWHTGKYFILYCIMIC